MKATIFHPPRGTKEVIELKNVYPEDEKLFIKHGIEVSMEALGNGDFAVYGDIGEEDEDGDPIEMIAISKGRSCEDTLEELLGECLRAMKV